MAASAGLERLERLGFGAIPPAQGAAVLGEMLRALGAATAQPQLLASVFFWDRLKTKGAVFEELKGAAPEAAAPKAPTAGALAAAAAASSVELSAEAIRTEVLAAAASVLGIAVNADDPLIAAGLDSLGEYRCAVCLGCTAAAAHSLRMLDTLFAQRCRRRGAAQ